MNYHPDLLKKGGRFHFCWLADSWPRLFQQHPPRNLRNYPVPQISTELRQIIENDSQSIDRSFSLRLGARLVHGLTLVHRKQADLLISDIFQLESRVRKEVKNLYTPSKKKRRTLTELYEHEKPIPADFELPKVSDYTVRNIEDITLREADITPTTITTDGFGEELDELDITDEMTKLDAIETDIQMETATEESSSVDTTQVLDVPTPSEIPSTSHIDKENPIDDDDASLETLTSPVPLKQRKMSDELAELKSLESSTTSLPESRKKSSLIIDKEIYLSTKIMECNFKETGMVQRCSTAAADTIKYDDVYLPKPHKLFKNPAHARCKRNYSHVLTSMFKRCAITRLEPDKRKSPAPKEKERARESTNDDSLVSIFLSDDLVATPTHVPETPEMSMLTDVRDTSVPMLADLTIEKNLDEIMTVAEYEETSNTTVSTKRVSETQLMPPPAKIPILDDANEIIVRADVHAALNEPVVSIPEDDPDEVGEGSLDRTLVSLGDESQTTSQKTLYQYLEESWGTAGVFKKILDAKQAGIKPLDLETIVNRNYSESMNVSRSMITARAFNSLLRLKKHGIVEIIKTPNTCKIFHIRLTLKAKSYA